MPGSFYCDGAEQAATAFVTDRKSTRLNSSHLGISYAVFCLKSRYSHWSVGSFSTTRQLLVRRIATPPAGNQEKQHEQTRNCSKCDFAGACLGAKLCASSSTFRQPSSSSGRDGAGGAAIHAHRSEEHTSE